MDEILIKLLEEEIKNEITGLSSLKAGSQEKSKAISDLAALHKLRIDEIKIENDFNDKREKRLVEELQRQTENDLKQKQLNDEAENYEREERFKKDQFKEEIKNRYLRLGVEAAGIILPMVFYAYWMRKGFKFEETGTFTSTTFRGLFNRFRPTNKN